MTIQDQLRAATRLLATRRPTDEPVFVEDLRESVHRLRLDALQESQRDAYAAIHGSRCTCHRCAPYSLLADGEVIL